MLPGRPLCPYGIFSGSTSTVLPLGRSEEHTSELQSHSDLVCRLLLEKKKTNNDTPRHSSARTNAASRLKAAGTPSGDIDGAGQTVAAARSPRSADYAHAALIEPSGRE